jgi:threonine/homoserine/homoserine lactone efflux protein
VLPTAHLLAFVLTSFALIVVPGPSVLFTVGRALALGRAAGVTTTVGNAAGVYVQVAAVAFGVGTLVERSVAVFTIIKLAGAGYLVYLGVQAIRHRRRLGEALEARVQDKNLRRILADGFFVGIANPKAIVFFAAVLPQFVDRQAGHVPEQMLLLGALFVTIGILSDSAWALVAGSARAWLGRSPRRLELIGGTGGLIMIGIGASLAVGGRTD